MNTELFKKIHDVIQADPAGFDMGSWEDRRGYGNPACGTTRCVAGWAIHFASGEGGLYVAAGYSPGVLALAKRYNALSARGRVMPGLIAARLLGLTGDEGQLFYAPELEAVEFVRLAAQGRDAEARAVLDR